MAFQLVLLENGRETRRVRATDRLVIGRADECALRLSDSSVSSRHAQIVEQHGELLIEDLGSHNKTVVEGGPSLGKGQRILLRRGMTLLFGRVQVTVEDEGGASVPASAGARPAADEPEQTLADPAALQPEPAVPEGESTLHAPPSMPSPAPENAHGPELASDSITLVPGPAASSPLAAHAFIRGLHPRLVVDNDAARRVIELGSTEFVIGRKEGALTLNHPRVSNPHARIFFEPELERLFLEDLGSKNGSFLNGEPLKPGVPRQIPAEAHLRFGTVDVLFLLDKGYDGESLEAPRARAVELLVRQRKTDHGRERHAREAAAREKLPTGAGLVLIGAVRAADWVAALSDARVAGVIDTVVGSKIRRLRLWVAVLVAALVGLLVFMWASRR